MIRRVLAASSFVVTSLLFASSALPATVTYQGYLYNFNGQPVNNGRVVAGTFKPRFNTDTWNYWQTFGDAVANADGDSYFEAVANGTFTPVGSPASTNSMGFFQGLGTTSAPVGSKIWVYGFLDQFLNDENMVLGTSAGSLFAVSAQPSVSIDVALADSFLWGSHFNNGFKTELGPIPEPATIGLVALGMAAMILVRNRWLQR
jgi:hypothetical protein